MIYKLLIIVLLFLNGVFAIGLKGLVIPQNALALSSSSTGIAGSIATEINPASIEGMNPYLGFSNNNWLGDLRGQKSSFLWNEINKSYLSFESLSVDDIELRNEIPNDSPLGFFGVYWYSLDFTRALNTKKIFKNAHLIKIGYKVKLNFSKLYTESMYGYTVDLGMIKNIKDNLSLGVAIRNIGKEYDKSLTTKTPTSYGIGVSYKIPKVNVELFSDILYSNHQWHNKFSMQTNFRFVNLIMGTTQSEDYHDISFGFKFDIKEWSFIYGRMNHDNAALGNPVSIELRKYF